MLAWRGPDGGRLRGVRSHREWVRGARIIRSAIRECAMIASQRPFYNLASAIAAGVVIREIDVVRRSCCYYYVYLKNFFFYITAAAKGGIGVEHNTLGCSVDTRLCAYAHALHIDLAMRGPPTHSLQPAAPLSREAASSLKQLTPSTSETTHPRICVDHRLILTPRVVMRR